LNYIARHIWGLIFMLPIAVATKADVLVLREGKKLYIPTSFITFHADGVNSMAIEDILDADKPLLFTDHGKDARRLETCGGCYWLRFQVQSLLEDSPYLEVSQTTFDSLEYHLVDHQGKLVRSVAASVNHSTLSGAWVINMHLKDDRVYTCYIKAKPAAPLLSIPIRIGLWDNLNKSWHRKNLVQGVFIGFLLFLLLYNLFLFTSIHDLSYLYFALYIGCTGLLFVIYTGFGIGLFWKTLPSFQLWAPTLGAASTGLLLIFSAKFLNSKENAPRLSYWLAVLALINIPLIILNAFGYTTIAVPLMVCDLALSLFLLMFLALKSSRNGYRPAKFYLIAWSFHSLGMILSLLLHASILDWNVSFLTVLQSSSSISVFFMSFALSKKINMYIEKQTETRALALKTLQQNEKLISAQNQLLEAKVHERTIDLEQTVSTLSNQRKELQEANAFKDKVFSIISHDLKSPISSLVGLLQIMKMKTLSEQEQNKAIGSLEVALKSTRNLLDNILAWASKKAHRTGEVQEIEIQKVVDEVFQVFQTQADYKEIELYNRINPGFHIQSNQDMLQIVLRNLVSNAIKFTKKRGTVEVGLRQDFLNVEIFVKDSGIGMNEATISKLFQSNKHNSTRGTENEKGTGLGLMLCKEFAEKHNGTIHVRSKPNEGSTFTIALNNVVPVVESVLEPIK
jgi:signal transduction histidine kinase